MAWSRCKIWLYATEYEPSGVFSGASRERLAVAVGLAEGWKNFVDDLVDIGFLDQHADGTYAIYNWAQRNPYVVKRDVIREQKTRAGLARAEKARAEVDKKISAGNELRHIQHLLSSRLSRCSAPSHSHPQKDSLSVSPTRAPMCDGESAREIFFKLVHESQPKAMLRKPAAWVRMLQKLVDAGQTVEDLECVMQWAMQDSFWPSRILSPKAFSDNRSKISIHMADTVVEKTSSDEQRQDKGMTADVWEKLNRERNETQAANNFKLHLSPQYLRKMVNVSEDLPIDMNNAVK